VPSPTLPSLARRAERGSLVGAKGSLVGAKGSLVGAKGSFVGAKGSASWVAVVFVWGLGWSVVELMITVWVFCRGGNIFAGRAVGRVGCG